MGRPAACNCFCDSPVDCEPFDCEGSAHSNLEGDESLYTLSSKSFGTGLTINSYSLAHESGLGHEAPCLKLSVNWSQSERPHFHFPSIIPPGGSGYEPLFAGWIIAALNDGPQVSLSAGEWLQDISLRANTRRINCVPNADTLTGRYLVRAYPPSGYAPAAGPLFTGGTFTLTIDGETTAAIDFDADAASVQAALEALSTVGSGGVTVTGGLLGQNFFSLHFTDGETHSISGSGAALEPHGGTIATRTPRHWNYSIIPVVIQDDVIYGPGPALWQFAPTVIEEAQDEGDQLAWNCREASSCPGKSSGQFGNTDPPGSNNQTAHSRYNEFLENPLAFPAGIDVPCQRYCRSQDSFGDWEFATIQRWNPTITTPAEFPFWDTWVPPTPDFSAGDYTLGFAVQFFSDEPGDYSADLLIDNLCLDWSVRDPLPACAGADLIVDEPMDEFVPEWTASILDHDPFSGDCDDVGLDQYFGANWRIEDGWLITDDVYREDGEVAIPIGDYTGVSPYFWRDRIYAGGSLFKEDIGSVSDWKNENFCLTLECELQRLHDEDAEWYAADEGSPDLNLHRPEEDFGIFIGGLVKFGVRRNAKFYGASTDNHTCDRSFYYLTVSGVIDTNGQLVTQCFPPEAHHGAYECDDIDEMGTHWQQYKTHSYTTGLVFSDWHINRAVPLKTDRLRLQVKWANITPDVQDCRAELRFYVRAWLNDQEAFHMTFIPGLAADPHTVNVSESAGETAWINTPSVGVFAHRGGKFRNFKCWLTPS